MLEQAIERLAVKVQKLREVIERQNAIAERDRTPPLPPDSDLPAAGASFLNGKLSLHWLAFLSVSCGGGASLTKGRRITS